MQLTFAQSLVAVSTAAAAWLMVRAGTAKGALKIRTPDRCASCGRLRTGRSCPCTRAEY
jgi:hypothetical protein